MAPIPVWSGNLRLSLVLVPVKMFPASEDGGVSFRMIHRESGEPIKYQKGIETPAGIESVPDEEIIKGYEYAKGHHVLIEQREIDDLKLEAKHTIDLGRFVDRDTIPTQFWEKPYYLLPDGDDALEGYIVLRDAMARAAKVAVGQLVMGGREHIVAITALDHGLLLEILRYAHEVRSAEEFFNKIEAKPSREAVKIAAELIEREVGPFKPETMPNEYARAVHELVRAKIERRAPQVELTDEPKAAPVINIMDALKKSMQSKGRAKVRDAVRRHMGDKAPKKRATLSSRQSKPRPTRRVH